MISVNFVDDGRFVLQLRASRVPAMGERVQLPDGSTWLVVGTTHLLRSHADPVQHDTIVATCHLQRVRP